MMPNMLKRSMMGLGLLGLLLVPQLRAAAGNPPDLMVSIEAWSPNQQTVVLTYAVPVSLQQVRDDVDNLSRVTGWSATSLSITQLAFVHVTESALPLYSAEFQSTGIVSQNGGSLPVGPVVTALHQYRHLLVVFDVPSPFQYTGSTSYSDRNVDIALLPVTPGSFTYAFQADITNPGFNQLNLPAAMSAPPGTPQQPGGPASPLARVLFALALAAGVGGIAYLTILRMMLRAESGQNS